MRLGRGVNIAPFSVRYEQLDAADFAGLQARGVEHVRIGGWIGSSLQNWTTCPASTLRMPANEQAAINHILAGEPAAPDVARRLPFWRLWLAAKAAVDAGLMVVLNPFHQRMVVDVTNETVQWVWAAVLQEFLVEDFPVDRVAFEMVNEPANWTHAKVDGNWSAIVHAWVTQVRQVQPNRMLMLTGVQGMRGGLPPSVSSWEGLVADLSTGKLIPADCGACMVTFHYYEPRWFTTQQHDSVTPQWVDSDEALTQMLEHFEKVVKATPSRVPVYLGEFGLATGKVDISQGMRWLEAVRRTAIRTRLAGFSVWTYYGTQNGLVPEVEGSSAQERLCAYDHSLFARAALGTMQAESHALIWNQSGPCFRSALAFNGSSSSPSGNRTCPADGDRRPDWADALLALPRPARPVTVLVSAALVIDIFAVVFLFFAAIYFVSFRWCSASMERDGAHRNRLVAGRQTVEFCSDAPPPSASPLQQDGLPPSVEDSSLSNQDYQDRQRPAMVPRALFRWRSSFQRRWETLSLRP